MQNFIYTYKKYDPLYRTKENSTSGHNSAIKSPQATENTGLAGFDYKFLLVAYNSSPTR